MFSTNPAVRELLELIKSVSGSCGLCKRTATLVFLMAPVFSVGHAIEAKLLVSATVMKQASLQVLTQPATVVVTAADIARGYVEVLAPAQFAVQSNSRNGYLLMFGSEGEFLRQTLVRGLGNDVQLDGIGGGVAQQSAGGSGITKAVLALTFRFILSDVAKQGVYAWPMRLSVSAL